MSRKHLTIFLSTILLAVTACNQEKFDNLQRQIDELKSVQVASVDLQVAGINGSIASLKEVDKSVKGYIGHLQDNTTELQGCLDAVNEQIESDESGIIDGLTEVKAEIEAQLALLNRVLGDLKVKEAALEGRIDALKSFADTELPAATDDWVAATLATLEQYDGLVTEIAGIKADVASIASLLADLEANMNGGAYIDMAAFISSLEEELRQRVSGIYTAIRNSESSMQSWVNNRLTGYYTIAEVNAKLDQLRLLYEQGDAALSDEIAALEQKLETAKTNLTAAYQQAIEAAITANNGVINAKIADDIQTATNSLQTQIDAINTRIAGLESRVATLEASVEELIGMVQDIVVIPSYSDGSVACGPGVNDVYFEVLPTGTAARLAAIGKEIFSMKAVYTITKSAQSFVSMPVSAVRADGDLLVITASAAGLAITEDQSANASLTIVSGLSAVSTGYFPLYFAPDNREISINLSAYNPFSATFACKVSNTDGITEYGICYSKDNTLCNNMLAGTGISDDGKFSITLDGLEPSSRYYAKAYAVVNGIARYSDISMVNTPPMDGIVETGEVSDVGAFSATIGGLISVEGVPGLSYGVCYSSSSQTPTIAGNNKSADNLSEGNFSVTVYGLTPSKDYYCRAYAKKNGEVVYGAVKTFHTTDSTSDVVTTGDYSDVTLNSAKISGRLNVAEGSYTSVTYGFSFEGNLEWVTSKDGDGVFYSRKTDLWENTTYQYRAAAMVDGVIYYGETVSFNTEALIVSTDQAVDLGLSVLWASCNLGASSPEELGYQFMWGDTTPAGSDMEGWKDYKYCAGTENTLTKYNSDPRYGMVDNKNVLDPDDDAAAVFLGNGWRMPTQEEWEELLRNRPGYVKSINGVYGIIIYASDRISIFLPRNGDRLCFWSTSGERTTAIAARANGMILEYHSGYWLGPWNGGFDSWVDRGLSSLSRPDKCFIRPVKDK